MNDFVTYLKNRTARLKNIKVVLNAAVTKQMAAAENPDLIVCATGSKIATPNIPGLLDNLADGNIMPVGGETGTGTARPTGRVWWRRSRIPASPPWKATRRTRCVC